MSNQRLTIVRLEKQQRALNADPIPNLLVKRKGFLDFHFCIYGLEGPYTGGFYHGILELASDYPFSPPQLKFFTESGRFQTNKAICTSFTNYHKEEWTSAWNVRTMLLGVISFMNSPQGGNGSIHESDAKKQDLARKSLQRNMQTPLFVQLFGQELKKLGHRPSAQKPTGILPQPPIKKSKQIEGSNLIYILIGILLILLITYGMFRNEITTWINGQA